MAGCAGKTSTDSNSNWLLIEAVSAHPGQPPPELTLCFRAESRRPRQGYKLRQVRVLWAFEGAELHYPGNLGLLLEVSVGRAD